MQQLISHKHAVVVDNTYLQKLYSLNQVRIDYDALADNFLGQTEHEVFVFISPKTRVGAFMDKLKSVKNLYATESGNPLGSFGELLMYMHATKDADVDDHAYFEIIANPKLVESYADLYSELTPNWIFRVWCFEPSYVTNRRNVVVKNLNDLNVLESVR